MKTLKSVALCLIVLSSIGLRTAIGQTNGAVLQNDPRAQRSGGGVHAARSVPASAAVPYNVARRPAVSGAPMLNPRPVTVNAPSNVSQQSNYSPFRQPFNPALAAMRARQTARMYNVQSADRMLAKNDYEFPQKQRPVATGERASADSSVQWPEILGSRQLPDANQTTVPNSFVARQHSTVLRGNNGAFAPREMLHRGTTRDWKGTDNRMSFSDASRSHWHEWHNKDWWCRHFTTIVLVSGGYYFWDAGYWYPAFGYDPLNSYYDYDGPIYTYGNLLPDEVIANVQLALQDAGYYLGAITGSLSVETRAALVNFQRDYGLPISGAIDQPTVETLGLY